MLGISIYPYGLAVAIAAAIALGVAAWNFRRAGLKQAALSWFAVLAIPLCFLAARFLYCLSTQDHDSFRDFFSFSRGGYMLYGALLGGLAALWLASRLSDERFPRMADELAVPMLVLIAIARLAEGLVGLGYGWDISGWFTAGSGYSLVALEDPSFFFRLPFAVADMYENYNWAVFVFEAIVACCLTLIVYRAKIRRPGGRAVLALLLYASTQELCESLRQDAVLRWGFVRINQVLGAVVVVALLALCFCLTQPRRPGRLALSIGSIVLGALLITLMEFMLEKKISALEMVPMDVCYVFTTIGYLLMIFGVHIQWRRAFGSLTADA